MVRQERLYEYIDYFLHLIIYDKLSKITNQGLGLFFKTSIGALIHPRNLLWAKKSCFKMLGFPSAASLLLNQGTFVITMSRWLGHAKDSIALDMYGHLIPSMQSEAPVLIDDVVYVQLRCRHGTVSGQFMWQDTQRS
jgi:hypothetical protein